MEDTKKTRRRVRSTTVGVPQRTDGDDPEVNGETSKHEVAESNRHHSENVKEDYAPARERASFARSRTIDHGRSEPSVSGMYSASTLGGAAKQAYAED